MIDPMKKYKWAGTVSWEINIEIDVPEGLEGVAHEMAAEKAVDIFLTHIILGLRR